MRICSLMSPVYATAFPVSLACRFCRFFVLCTRCVTHALLMHLSQALCVRVTPVYLSCVSSFETGSLLVLRLIIIKVSVSPFNFDPFDISTVFFVVAILIYFHCLLCASGIGRRPIIVVQRQRKNEMGPGQLASYLKSVSRYI